MSAPLAETLSRDLCGRVAWVGLGNAGRGDDGVGVRLAEELRAAFCPEVFCAGTEVEKWIPDIRLGAFHHVVFLDAVDAGAESGSVVWLSQDELRVRYPQVSTHKLALSTLAGILSNACATRVWLLGVQVGRLDGEGLSPEVEKTEGSLRELILALMDVPSTPDKEYACRLP